MFHLYLLLLPIYLGVDDLLAELASSFDVHNGEFLSVDGLHDLILVQGPLRFDSNDETEEGEDEEPTETVDQNQEAEEVVVDEERALEPWDFEQKHERVDNEGAREDEEKEVWELAAIGPSEHDVKGENSEDAKDQAHFGYGLGHGCMDNHQKELETVKNHSMIHLEKVWFEGRE